MTKTFLLTKIDPHYEAWRGRSDADAVHVCAENERQAREAAAKLNATEIFHWSRSPWLSELHAECEVEYAAQPYRQPAVS